MVLRKDFIDEVLRLPRDARAELALRVLDSLMPNDDRTSEEWIAEVERRARRAIAGEPARSFDDVVAEMDETLR